MALGKGNSLMIRIMWIGPSGMQVDLSLHKLARDKSILSGKWTNKPRKFLFGQSLDNNEIPEIRGF